MSGEPRSFRGSPFSTLTFEHKGRNPAMYRPLFWFFCTVLIFSGGSLQAAGKKTLKAAIGVQSATEKAAADSQKKIDRIADKTDQMLAEYKLVMSQYDALKGYNDQVAKVVASQEEELVGIDAQLAEIDATNQGVMPLMARMVETLGRFVELDVPFLPEERRKRVADLQALLDRADVTVAEKFRRILEAYQVEMEYGRTIEAYTDDLVTDGRKRSVDFLRIGRMTFLYQTLDQKETAVWNAKSRRWEVLDQSYRKPVMQGLRIARKQAPPDLLKLPVPAPEAVQ